MPSIMQRGLVPDLMIIALLLALVGVPYAGAVDYTYDDLNRLIRVDYSDGRSLEYTYDGVGNRVQQRACSYSLSTAIQSFYGPGGTGTTIVMAGAACAWTASTDASWITITSGNTGTGNGSVGYTVASNPGANTRTGTISVAGQMVTVSQTGATGGSDVNGDGKVDCTDVATLKESFGKKSGQTGFNPRADVNGDGVVDVRDLATVSRQLPAGTRCP